MKKLNKNKIDNIIDNHPYFYLPFLFKLSESTKDKFKIYLNSLALRHPNRVYLKNFLSNHLVNNNIIIEDFIKNNPKIKSNKNIKENSKDLSKPIHNKGSFISENIAKIYIKQNKISDALKIYEKLISLNSKKKTYFAKKIKNLKK